MSTSHALLAIGMAKETTFGTAVTPPTIYVIADPSSQMKVEHTPIEIRGRAGVRQDLWKVAAGPKSVKGVIKFHPESENLGLILKSFFGTSSAPTSLGSGAYKHIFKPLQISALPSLTICVDRGATGGYFTYSGCVVDKLIFEGDNKGALVVTAEILGVDEAAGSALTPSISTVAPFIFSQVAIDINGANTDVEKWKVAMSNATRLKNAIQGGGTRVPQAAIAGISEVDIEASLWWENSTYRADWIAATVRNFTMTATGASIGGGFSHTLKLLITKLLIGESEFGDRDGAIGLEIKGKALYDATGGVVTNVECDVTNTVSSAY